MNPIKKLKYQNYFYGHYVWVAFFIPISLFISLAVDYFVSEYFDIEVSVKYFLIASFIIFLILTWLLSCIVRRNSKADREKIENSEFPDWLPLTEKIESAVKADNTKDDLIAYIFLAVIIWLFFIVYVPDVLSKIIITVFLVILGFIFYAISKYNKNFWENIDDTAIYAEIPVDRIKKVARKGGHDIYAYFYLPDGKYVVKVTKSNLDKLTFVCYKNRIKILEFDSKDIFLKDSSDYKEIAEKMEELREKYLSNPPEELKELLKESDPLDDLDEEIPEEW